jgi:hypothetical protein
MPFAALAHHRLSQKSAPEGKQSKRRKETFLRTLLTRFLRICQGLSLAADNMHSHKHYSTLCSTSIFNPFLGGYFSRMIRLQDREALK